MASNSDPVRHKLNRAERIFLRHFGEPWSNIVNKRSFYVFFLTRDGKKEWTPRGPTGATVASLMKRGLIDFAPKPGRIGKLIRINSGNRQ